MSGRRTGRGSSRSGGDAGSRGGAGPRGDATGRGDAGPRGDATGRGGTSRRERPTATPAGLPVVPEAPRPQTPPVADPPEAGALEVPPTPRPGIELGIEPEAGAPTPDSGPAPVAATAAETTPVPAAGATARSTAPAPDTPPAGPQPHEPQPYEPPRADHRRTEPPFPEAATEAPATEAPATEPAFVEPQVAEPPVARPPYLPPVAAHEPYEPHEPHEPPPAEAPFADVTPYDPPPAETRMTASTTEPPLPAGAAAEPVVAAPLAEQAVRPAPVGEATPPVATVSLQEPEGHDRADRPDRPGRRRARRTGPHPSTTSPAPTTSPGPDTPPGPATQPPASAVDPHAPTRPAGRVPWRASAVRRALGPVPLTALVGLEVLALGVGLARVVPSTVALAVGVAIAVVGVLLLLPRGGWSLGGWLVRRARFAATPRVAQGTIGDPSAPLALLPGVRVRQVRTPRDDVFAVAWRSGVATVALDVPGASASPDAPGAPVPVGAVVERLAAAGLQAQDVAIVEHSRHGHRVSRTLAVRLDPQGAPAAVAARGGGERGVYACLATIVATAVAVLAEHGLRARPLEREDLLDLLVAQADPSPQAAARPVWHGAWSAVVGPELAQRVLVVTELGPAVDATALRVAVAHEWVVVEAGGEPDEEGLVPARVLVRLADESPAALDAATASLRGLPGVRVEQAADRTLDALRATTAVGSGRPHPDRAGAIGAGPLAARMAVPARDLGLVL